MTKPAATKPAAAAETEVETVEPVAAEALRPAAAEAVEPVAAEAKTPPNVRQVIF